MHSQLLKSLSEHLLRAGVAHRHVRRYMRELHDHYEDAVREELAKGLDRSLAEPRGRVSATKKNWLAAFWPSPHFAETSNYAPRPPPRIVWIM